MRCHGPVATRNISDVHLLTILEMTELLRNGHQPHHDAELVQAWDVRDWVSAHDST
jgi:hypothetical protein